MSGVISVISFSETGLKFQQSLKPDIEQWAALLDMQTHWYCKDQAGCGLKDYILVDVPTKEWSANRFEDSDIIVYISTVAKAVRNFASSMKGQSVDPAVIAIDQLGRYSVPILSGRQGEAYDLCLWLEQKNGLAAVNSGGAMPGSIFSITQFAQDNDMTVSNANYAKEITAALDSGEKIGFYTSFPVKGDLPEGITWSEKGPLGIYLSPSYHNAYFVHTLWLIPKCIEVGIRVSNPGVTPRDIDNALSDLLKSLSIYPESVQSVNAMKEEDMTSVQIFAGMNEFMLNVLDESDLRDIKTAFPGLEYFECAAIKGSDSQIISREVLPSGISIALAMKKIYVAF